MLNWLLAVLGSTPSASVGEGLIRLVRFPLEIWERVLISILNYHHAISRLAIPNCYRNVLVSKSSSLGGGAEL